MRTALVAAAIAAMPAAAFGQDAGVSTNSSSASMGALIAQGYEIKAAVPNGAKIIVFLQKDKSAYACEFASLTSTRCGAIN